MAFVGVMRTASLVRAGSVLLRGSAWRWGFAGGALLHARGYSYGKGGGSQPMFGQQQETPEEVLNKARGNLLGLA